MFCRRSGQARFSALVVITLGGGCAGPAGPQTAWLKAHAVALSSLDEPLPEAVTAALRAQASRRFIALGEGDHFVADKYAYRLALLQTLVMQLGARQLVMEIGGSDAARIDAFLESGDEAELERVVLYGYRGHSAAEQRELAPFPAIEPSSCEARFVRGELAFWREVRALSQQAQLSDGRRVRLFGFDFDAKPGGGFEDARRALQQCAAGHALMSQLTPPQGSSGLQEVQRLRRLAEQIQSAESGLPQTCGEASASQIAQIIRRLADAYDIAMAWAQAGEDLAAKRAMFDRREALMAEQLRALPPQGGAPMVVLGHNMHLAKRSSELRFGPAGDDLPMWPSVMTRLEEESPGSVFVMWLLYGRGTRLHPGPDGACEQEVRVADASVEELLDSLGQDIFVPVAEAPSPSFMDEPLPFGTHTSRASGRLRGAVDALIYLRTAHASP